MSSVEQNIQKVVNDIVNVEAEIKKVESEIVETEDHIRGAKTEDDLKFFREQKNKLREEKNQLREKENKLREEKNMLLLRSNTAAVGPVGSSAANNALIQDSTMDWIDVMKSILPQNDVQPMKNGGVRAFVKTKFNIVGREDTIADLVEQVFIAWVNFTQPTRDRSQWKLLLLHGGSGVGKSRINLEFLKLPPETSSIYPLITVCIDRLMNQDSKLSQREVCLRRLLEESGQLVEFKSYIASTLHLFMDINMLSIKNLKRELELYNNDSDIYLGLRVAVSYYFPNPTDSCSALNSILNSPLFLANPNTFSFQNVMDKIAERMVQSSQKLLQLSIDEFQTLMDSDDKLLKNICRKIMYYSYSSRNVYIVPLLSGTYPLSAMQVFEPTQFKLHPVLVTPLSMDQSINVLQSSSFSAHKIVKERLVNERRFYHLLGAMGGICRSFEILEQELIRKHDVRIELLYEHIQTYYTSLFRMHDVEEAEALFKLVVSGDRVTEDTKVHNRTVGELAKQGMIYLENNVNQTYQIYVPILVASSLLSSVLNNLSWSDEAKKFLKTYLTLNPVSSFVQWEQFNVQFLEFKWELTRPADDKITTLGDTIFRGCAVPPSIAKLQVRSQQMSYRSLLDLPTWPHNASGGIDNNFHIIDGIDVKQACICLWIGGTALFDGYLNFPEYMKTIQAVRVFISCKFTLDDGTHGPAYIEAEKDRLNNVMGKKEKSITQLFPESKNIALLISSARMESIHNSCSHLGDDVVVVDRKLFPAYFSPMFAFLLKIPGEMTKELESLKSFSQSATTTSAGTELKATVQTKPQSSLNVSSSSPSPPSSSPPSSSSSSFSNLKNRKFSSSSFSSFPTSFRKVLSPGFMPMPKQPFRKLCTSFQSPTSLSSITGRILPFLRWIKGR